MGARRPARPFAHQGGVLVMAHRGWSGKYPENTVLSFEKAAELGVDVLELDVHATRDGVLVVFHDETVDRMTDGHGLLREMTWDALQRLEVGANWTTDGRAGHPFRGRGLRVPALEEVLASFPDHWLGIGLKNSLPSVVGAFVAVIRDYQAEDRVCVRSADAGAVATIRRRCPEVVTVATIREARRLRLLSRVGLGGLYRRHSEQVVRLPGSIGRRGIITPRLIRAAHANRLAVHVGAVNAPETMRSLVALGVDGIVTDHPDRLIDVLMQM